jgi:hypothetical protein
MKVAKCLVINTKLGDKKWISNNLLVEMQARRHSQIAGISCLSSSYRDLPKGQMQQMV